MTQGRFLSIIAAVAILAAGPTLVQAVPTYHLDLDASSQDTIEDAISAGRGQTVHTLLVLAGAEDLLGYSTDLKFDSNALNLLAVQETPGDLNFDGMVTLQEVNDAINFFVNNLILGPGNELPLNDENPLEATRGAEFVDSDDNASGVLLDLRTANNELELDEVNAVITDFVLSLPPDGSIDYWSDVVGRRTDDPGTTEVDEGTNESVEISDPVAESNKDGGSHPGEVLDLCGVLLARPDRVDGNEQRPGFGFDGDAILMSIYFQVRNDAVLGGSTIQFSTDAYVESKPVYITEMFKGIEEAGQEGIQDAAYVEAVVTVTE